MPNYGDKRYWDKRYRAKNTVFEWLENFEELRTIIEANCPSKEAPILNLGCGNSIIQEDMYDDGYTNIHNIDISQVCIDQMIARQGTRTGLVYKTMDCTDLKYPDETFDFIIDKSTVDALLCGEDSYLNVARTLSEAQRVLKPNGVYLIVSYGSPNNRTFHFERPHLDFSYTVQQLPAKDAEDGSGGKQNPHHAFILKKGPNATQNYLDNFESVICELIEEEEEEKRKNPHIYDDESDEDERGKEKQDENTDQDDQTAPKINQVEQQTKSEVEELNEKITQL